MKKRRVLWVNDGICDTVYTVLFEDSGRLYLDLSYANDSRKPVEDREEILRYIRNYVSRIDEEHLRYLVGDMRWEFDRLKKEKEWESIPEELRDRLQQQIALDSL